MRAAWGLHRRAYDAGRAFGYREGKANGVFVGVVLTTVCWALWLAVFG